MRRGHPIRRAVATLAAGLACGLGAASAPAAATPIPEGPAASSLPVFEGSPATARPVASPAPPRHPFMAPNGRSNLHEDAFQTDVHQGPGPLGRSMARLSNFLVGDCASITFDRRGRIVTVCVGLAGPKLYLRTTPAGSTSSPTPRSTASMPTPPARRRSPGASPIPTTAPRSPGSPRRARARRRR